MRAQHGRQGRAGTAVLRALPAAVALAVLAGCGGTAGTEPTASASPEPSATTPAATASATTAPSPTAAPTGGPVAGDVPTNGPLAITAPTSGASVPGPQVAVTGTGTAFEGNLLWQLVEAGTGVVGAEGFTTGGANGETGPFAFSATVPSGTWTLHVWEPGMGEGESGGERRNEVTVTFTVS